MTDSIIGPRPFGYSAKQWAALDAAATMLAAHGVRWSIAGTALYGLSEWTRHGVAGSTWERVSVDAVRTWLGY